MSRRRVSRKARALRQYERVMTQHYLASPREEQDVSRAMKRAFDLGASEHQVYSALGRALRKGRRTKRTKTWKRR